MKKLIAGWLVWLTQDNLSRRISMVKSSAESLSLLGGNAYDVVAINNGGIELPFRLPDNIDILKSDKNFIDLSAIYFPYLVALERECPYFCYLYDDFLIYDDALEDAIEFMDRNTEVSCMRITSYKTNDPYYNSRLTSKSINPDAVSHLEGAGDSISRTLLKQTGPIQINNHKFYFSNWRPNSRPMLWRTREFAKFASLEDREHPVMQPFEARMYKIADNLAINGLYASSYLEGGMCKTFPIQTSERTRHSSDHWWEYTVDMSELKTSYGKARKKK